MIGDITYNGVSGSFVIPSTELAYKTPIVVLREGIEQDLVSLDFITVNQGGLIVGRQVLHDVMTGFLQFDSNIPFVGSGSSGATDVVEKVHVIYKS